MGDWVYVLQGAAEQSRLKCKSAAYRYCVRNISRAQFLHIGLPLLDPF